MAENPIDWRNGYYYLSLDAGIGLLANIKVPAHAEVAVNEAIRIAKLLGDLPTPLKHISLF